MTQVGILGAGLMGRQIAVLCAAHGMPSILWNRKHREGVKAECLKIAMLEARRGNIHSNSPETASQLVSVSDRLDMLASCQVVIECVSEDVEIKRTVLRNLEPVVSKEALVASNTSTLGISRLSEGMEFAERFIGLHFFNPALSMKLVEISLGTRTSASTEERARQFAVTLGKQAVVLAESPGHIVNRLLFPLINDAVLLLSQGRADAATVDRCMKLGALHPMGPLELADFVGLDICVNILQNLARDLKDDHFKPTELLLNMVREGKLGRKSGCGFYPYRKRTA